jgi:competence protein ComFC
VAEERHFGKSLGAWLGAASDAVVSVFYPATCRLCERLLIRATRLPVCEGCLASFAALPGPVCDICGSPLTKPFASTMEGVEGGSPNLLNVGSATGLENGRPGCLGCLGRTYAFERVRSYAAYQGQLVRAIVMLKFERVEPLAVWFAKRLANLVDQEHLAADVVVPVALHHQRERERGYNQAGLIARPLARQLGLPYRPVLLMRTKPRPDKHILSLSERWESVRGAFATRPGSQVDNLRVLLIDDVMTTGATLVACAKALRQAGAKSVIGLTVARAIRHPIQGSPYEFH